MGFSNWFKTKATKEDLEKIDKKNKSAFDKIKLELKNSSKILNTHSSQIETNLKEKLNRKQVTLMIKKSNKTLEERLGLSKQVKHIRQPSKQLRQALRQPLEVSKQQTATLDFDRFTEKEQNILKISLEHKDMALSSIDIGKALNKSPSTIRSQLNTLKLKEPNLFNTFVDNKQQVRYKLRENLIIKKQLSK